MRQASEAVAELSTQTRALRQLIENLKHSS
jgi:hypothetical protein